MNRPKCIECGSKEVISKGVMWLCKSCGRWFTKKVRGQTLNKNFEKEFNEIWKKLRRQTTDGQVPIHFVCKYIWQKKPELLQKYGFRNDVNLDTFVSRVLKILYSD